MTRAAELARKCFALAASTTHDGERAAGVNRGMAILQRHGLNPDDFDIPGRVRPAPGRFKLSPEGAARKAAAQARADEFMRRNVAAFEAEQEFARYARAMREMGGAFSMDSLVREAVEEAMRRAMRRQTGADDD